MMKQFFGKKFWYLFALCAAIFVDAVISYVFDLGGYTLGIYFVLAFVIAYKNLAWGLCFSFLELFTNSHGKLIFTTVAGQTLSLRMVLFLAVVLAWLILLAQHRVRMDVRKLKPFLVLCVGVALGCVGLLLNDPVSAFQDGNAYMYLLYLGPILSVTWTSEYKRLLLQTLAAGSAWIVLVSLAILYLYAHFSEFQLEPIYLFLRDTRIAEITFVTPSIYRVFIQSQFFIIVLASFFLAWLAFRPDRKTALRLMFLLAPVSAIVLISFSRSFWFGILAAGVTCIACSLYAQRTTIKQFGRFTIHTLASAAMGIILFAAVVLFPFPQRNFSGDLGDAFRQRTGADVAISSRWKLLEPMWKKIAEAPVLGSGFGTTVSFVSDDPRVRSMNPDGLWTTYSMEWGWLELWIKMGMFGPLGFLIVAYNLLRSFIPSLRSDHQWLSIGFISSIAFLFSTHTFSPYLNHPIGLGFLLLAFIFAEDGATPVLVEVEESKTIRNPTLSPALTSQHK